MQLQCQNPYLPSWEYIAGNEPYVFNNRVYIYGSHDRFNGYSFCLNDYVCWSASVDDLGNWWYEGLIYEKTNDPMNKDGKMNMNAPDVTVGPDGRYYLYYVLDKTPVISVAVCSTPAGKYEFYGYVKYPDQTRLGEREGDEMQFDPAVITEGDVTYVYSGLSGYGDPDKHGAMVTELGPDMLTVTAAPVFIIPSSNYADGTEFEGHAYCQAPSIRKKKDTYYFIYASNQVNELCYATSKHPTKGFKYGGVIISNCDLNIDTYKLASEHSYPEGPNHGSIVEIKGQWYVFYTRQTNGSWFSRQGCIEKIHIDENGFIKQVEMTSGGANKNHLIGRGEYSSYTACNLFNAGKNNDRVPRVTQEGVDGTEDDAYISDIRDNAVIGFKYFDCKDIKRIAVKVRGYCDGGVFEIRTSLQDEPLGYISVTNSNAWTNFHTDIEIPDGIHPLYFTFKGLGILQMESFSLK